MMETNLTTPLTTPAKAVIHKPRKKELKNLTRREGIWYFQKVVNGKKEFNGRRTPFSLDTGDLVLAKTKRDAILRAGTGAEVDRVLGRTQKAPATLAELFEAYRAAPTVRANATTREHNISDLTRAVRLVKGEGAAVEKLSSAELDKAFVKKWQTLKLAAAAAEAGCDDAARRAGRTPDLPAFEAAKRSMNSLLTHMQSLFSREARDDYGHLYLPPNIADFATALPVAARKREEPKQLDDAFVSGLLAAVPELQAESPAAWAAFQLMLWGGLRNRECLFARTGWLEEIPLGYRLTMRPAADFLPKGNSRAVILPAAIVRPMLAQLPPDDDHLVPARTVSDRHEACYRLINQWLKRRGVGEDANKIAYRLRKYFLAKVAEQQGVMLAQAAGGHSDMRTTEEGYIGRPKMKAPISLSNI